MDIDLRGKKAVITGGTRGIGRAIAETLAKNGADIALCARNVEQVRSATKVLARHGVRAIGEAIDIADGTALRAWVAESGERLQGIDILVCNPSAFGIGASEEEWRQGFEVDLMGAVRAVEAATPFLEQAGAQHGDASIVVLGSVLGTEADRESAYGAMKAAAVHFTKGVARRLAPKRVRANAISPGTVYVEDGFWANAKRHLPEVYAEFLGRNPMGRMGGPQEIANIAAFLASPAASFTTGANIVVDGAFTSRVNF
jgi:3-oxoacyl-[acyl-carrier protein] reductase